jgi:small subunit ribosomal protein S19
MVKKEFTYKGKTLEELKTLSDKELIELLPSSQRRKLKRGLTDVQKKMVRKMEKKDSVKTHLRNMIVLPKMVGTTVRVHSGKEFLPVIIQPEMIGHYLGEFILTRKKTTHNAPGVGATKSSSNISVK